VVVAGSGVVSAGDAELVNCCVLLRLVSKLTLDRRDSDCDGLSETLGRARDPSDTSVVVAGVASAGDAELVNCCVLLRLVSKLTLGRRDSDCDGLSETLGRARDPSDTAVVVAGVASAGDAELVDCRLLLRLVLTLDRRDSDCDGLSETLERAGCSWIGARRRLGGSTGRMYAHPLSQ